MRRSEEGRIEPPSAPGLRLPYLPQLDGLRAAAVGAVVAYHAGVPGFRGGYIGVEVFFVLSGFLITMLLQVEQYRTGKIALRAFYGRRLRRLFPALLVAVSVVGLVWLAIPSAPRRNATLAGVPASIFYASGWLQAFQVSHLGALGHTWSLSVEEYFYAFWPLLVAWATRRRVRIVTATAALLVVATAAYYYAVADLARPRYYFAPDLRAKDLLTGCLLASLIASRPRLGAGLRVRLVALPSALLLLAWTAGVSSESSVYKFGAPAPLLATAALVATLHGQPGWWLSRVLAHPIPVWIGRRSYAIYLWHFPVFEMTRHFGGPPAVVTIGVLLTLALSAASFVFVEEPFRRRGRHRGVAVPAAALS